MDVVTQCVFGAAAGQAVMGRKLPRSAWLAGALGGYVPDADIFIRPAGDPLGGLLWHRHFTHGIGFIPIGALIAVLPLLLFPAGRRAFKWLYLAALVGIATHGPLDACTSYGTCLWWPISTARVSWDLVGIIDPLVTLPMLTLTAWSAVLSWRRRVRDAAPGVDTTARGGIRWRRVAVAGAVWGWAYILIVGGLMHARAASAVAQLARQRGHTEVRGARVMPQPLTLLLWRSIYIHEGRVWSDAVHTLPFAPARVIRGEGLPLVEVDDAVSRAPGWAREAVEGFYWFADGYVAADPENPRFLGDMRYSIDPQRFSAMWGVRLPDNEPPGTRLFGRPSHRATRTEQLWDQLTLKDPRWEPVAPEPR